MSDPPMKATVRNNCVIHSATVVVMAKSAVAGQVKTRLIGQISAEQAAAVHNLMLQCVLARASATFTASDGYQCVLALDADVVRPDNVRDGLLADLDPKALWRRTTQGPGDLGQRLTRIWRRFHDRPIVFFGADSPDVPFTALGAILPALQTADVVLGPVPDGGYWTIAGRHLDPHLFQGIDWGTCTVYDQTRRAAKRAGLSVAEVPSWLDVDRPGDLDALRARIASSAEPALIHLGARLKRICEGTPP